MFAIASLLVDHEARIDALAGRVEALSHRLPTNDRPALSQTDNEETP